MTAPIEDWSKKEKLLNWAGCYEYGINANHLHQPRSIEEVQELVRRVDKIKAVGTRHCFNGKKFFVIKPLKNGSGPSSTGLSGSENSFLLGDISFQFYFRHRRFQA